MDSDVYMHACVCECMCERKITHDMYIYNITKSKLNNDYYYNGRIVIQWQMQLLLCMRKKNVGKMGDAYQ